ncbi:DNA-protecting protein DprA [Candidatus Berkelbacteria bacterium]|nr:DNA-protecting protein DprA [Candidatus Berkelbacteria bacterium]
MQIIVTDVQSTITRQISESERATWAALASDIRFGARHFAALLTLGEPLEMVVNNAVAVLVKRGIELAVAQLTHDIIHATHPESVLTALTKQSITLITRQDPEYPLLLSELAVPPAVLYVRGKIDESPCLAVVGTRRVSLYGRRVTEDLVTSLSRQGLVIVSGLALGIDGIAHQAALAAEGVTWAVLGCGVDRVYPTSHEHLARDILDQGGALISEFPPGTPALRHHFPVRNRIIAGLARATLVVEATEQSGSLITARSALEANRDVLTVPGSIYAPGSAGPHRLIQLGAKLVHTVDDVLSELGLDHGPAESDARAVIADSAEERLILTALSSEPLLLDRLIESVALDAPTVLSTLTLMEMKGKVRNLGGNLYVRR